MNEPIYFYISELNAGIKKTPNFFHDPRQQPIRVGHSVPRSKSGLLVKSKALLREYLECSSIHGLNQLAKKGLHWSEYVLWLVVLAAAVTGTAYLGHQAWRRYSYSPTVISIEKDYKNWNTTFSTLTICPKNKLDDVKLNALAERYKVRDAGQFVNFFKTLSALDYDVFSALPEYEDISPDEYLQILKEARFNFTYELNDSQDSKQDLQLTVTETGLCYTFNSEVGRYFTPENLNAKLPVKRWKDDLLQGSPLDGELFAQIMKMSSGYNVSISSPFDLPDLGIRQIPSEMRHYLLLDITALSIISADNIRNLSPEQRRCRFYEESNLEVSSVYSYSLCRMQCRADLAFKLCGCIPYFYRKSKGRPYCGATGMRCLGRNGRRISQLRDQATDEKLPCRCLPLCNDVHYLIEFERLLEWERATNLKFRLAHYPRTRLKRNTIFGFSDLLVSIGGTAGLFLGCSVLSFVEILYFLTIRLFFFVRSHVRTGVTMPNGKTHPAVQRRAVHPRLIHVMQANKSHSRME